MYNEWSETKKSYRTGLIVSSFISFLLLIWPGNKIDISQKNFIKETVILATNPIFDEEYHGKSSTEFYVKMLFKGDSQEYKITGIDYNFLKYDEFLKIKAGDTLTIARTNNKIHSLVKNGFDFLNYSKAETNRGLNISFLGYLFLPMIAICLIVLSLKNRPYFRFNNKLHEVPLEIITLILFILTIIVLIIVMPKFIMITNGQFYD